MFISCCIFQIMIYNAHFRLIIPVGFIESPPQMSMSFALALLSRLYAQCPSTRGDDYVGMYSLSPVYIYEF